MTSASWAAWLVGALASAGAGRVSWRLATVFTSYLYAQKTILEKKIKISYTHDFEDVVTANGEVGISGSRCKPYRKFRTRRR
jgi:hypothetical protein